MPELPEVETVMRGMANAMQGKIIARADVNRPDIRTPIPQYFADILKNRAVESFERRGKYILVFLKGHHNHGDAFVLHLGMSGRIRIAPPRETYKASKHDHVVFHLKDGTHVIFNDARRFGMVFLIDKKNWRNEPPFNAMGPEPLEKTFTASALAKGIGKRKGPIKNILLNQSVISGIGNIYACEALYLSGIHPSKSSDSLNAKEIESLAGNIKVVLMKAIKAGGSSLRDHRQTNGELGYFQHQFQVYAREGEKCGSCDCDVLKTGGVQRIVQAGRSTFYCPQKQKLKAKK